jgi:uncharacterized membrane protein
MAREARPAASAVPGGLRRWWGGHGRLFLSIAVGVVVFAALPAQWTISLRLIGGWNALVLAYLVQVWLVVRDASVVRMRQRAAFYDEDDLTFLFLMLAGAAASFIAVVVEIAQTPRLVGTSGVVAGLTIVLSWVFTHTLFALHYAHSFYQLDDDGDDKGGLLFAGLSPDYDPTYLDFFYFSFVIGCATATADISITRRNIRRLALIHGVVSFAFNTTILALTINLAAGTLGAGKSS